MQVEEHDTRKPFPLLPQPSSYPEVPFSTEVPLTTAPASYKDYPTVALTLPTQIASFSYDADHTLRFDDSSLRYFVPPPAGADLERGYENWKEVPLEDDDGRLDSLLLTYARAVERGFAGRVDVITWRGMMTRFLISPYEEREGWEMNAQLVDGTLYLQDYRPAGKHPLNAFHHKLSYTGMAFESYCASENPPMGSASQGWQGDANSNIQWCHIVKTKLARTNLVLGGEVDCVKGDYTGESDNFVELKTTGAIKTDRDRANFEKKCLKYWAQSYLLAIPEVVVGFRSAQPPYRLLSYETFETWRFPQIGQRAGWSATACLNFSSTALEYIRAWIAEESRTREQSRPGRSSEDTPHPGSFVYRVTFQPGMGMSVRKLSVDEVEKLVSNSGRIGILPKDYWDWLIRRTDIRNDHSHGAPT